MAEADKIYEVKKTVTLTPNMQLIDLNGSRKNFQSDVVARSSKPFRACVLNQDQLDAGEFSFEQTENGKYARRVTFQDDRLLNHYLAVKGDEGVECSVVVRLREMPPQPPQPPPSSQPSPPALVDEMEPTNRAELQQQLKELSQDPGYQKLPGGTGGTGGELDLEMGDDDIILPPPAPKKSKWNIYIIVGVLCLAMCAFLWWRSSSTTSTTPSVASKTSKPSTTVSVASKTSKHSKT